MSAFDVDFYSNQKLLVIPQDPVDNQRLLVIDRKTKYDVGSKYGIVSGKDWQMNTVANEALESILQAIATGMTVEGNGIGFNFYNLFFIKATNRRVESADKEGNINVVFEPGPRATELITLTEPPKIEQQYRPEMLFGFTDDPDRHEQYLKIDRLARYSLAKKYRYMIPDDLVFASFAVLDQFFLNMFEYLLHDLGQNPEQMLSSVNFNDNVEVHAMRKKQSDDGTDDLVSFSMRPGMNAKLIVKSDSSTEEDGSDDE